MTMKSTISSFSLLAAGAAAQAIGSQPGPDLRPMAASPWHIGFAASPDDGAQWAAGADYKVAVRDDMTFYPRVARDRTNQPLRWRTRSIRSGPCELLPAASVAAAPAPRATGFRVEIDHGAAIETYEATAEGVEQSFLVHRPERLAGDLEIVGEVSSSLRAAARAPAHAPLAFSDPAGTPVVSYGAATAIDACGRRLPMTSAFADGRITLRVPAAWLATAAWPVTVDPLLARVAVGGSALGPASAPQVVRSDTFDRLFVAESRENAAGDWDYVVRAFADDWTFLGVVFTDLGVHDTESGSLAYSGDQEKLVLAFQRRSGLSSSVHLYFHPAASLVPNSGVVFDLPRPAGSHDSEPSLGGSADRYCYLALRRDVAPLPSNSAQSRVLGTLVDAQTHSALPPQSLHTLPGTNYDAEHPSVSGYSETGGWLVAWQEYNYDNAGDDWDLIAQRVGGGGALLGGAALGQDSDGTLHKLTPRVAGSGSRFAVTFLVRDNLGTKPTALVGRRLYFQRISWPAGGAMQHQILRILDAVPTEQILLGSTTRAIDYDFVTDSLWAVAWKRLDSGSLHVERIGYDAAAAESARIDAVPGGSLYEPSLGFDDDAMGFALVYATTGMAPSDPTFATRLLHAPATIAPFGASCAGSIATSNNGSVRPYAGSEFFALRLLGGVANAPTVLVAGAGAANLPLPSGGPGCTLLLDPTLPLVVLPAGVADGSGEITLSLPIPSRVGNVDVRWQFVQQSGASLASSSGLLTRVR